jgi:Ca-activated chloride channel family protein
MTRFFLIAVVLLAAPLPAQHEPGDSEESAQVTLWVTVTDKRAALVNGLPSTVFEIFEDGDRRTIRSFVEGRTPVSLGILLDNSASMNRELAPRNSTGQTLPSAVDSTTYIRNVLSRFLDSFVGDEDEAFLLVFGTGPELETGFTNDLDQILESLPSPSPAGRTALVDALRLALRKMEVASNARKAILLISDGGDNVSVSRAGAVKKLVRESDATIYSIGVFGLVQPQAGRTAGWEGHDRLSWLARQSGGKYLPVITPDGFLSSADRIGKELTSQYRITYTPRASDVASRRDVKVKVKLREHRKQVVDSGGKLPLRAHTRAGYYYTPSGNDAP